MLTRVVLDVSLVLLLGLCDIDEQKCTIARKANPGEGTSCQIVEPSRKLGTLVWCSRKQIPCLLHNLHWQWEWCNVCLSQIRQGFILFVECNDHNVEALGSERDRDSSWFHVHGARLLSEIWYWIAGKHCLHWHSYWMTNDVMFLQANTYGNGNGLYTVSQPDIEDLLVVKEDVATTQNSLV